jgi:hypothetical protein
MISKQGAMAPLSFQFGRLAVWTGEAATWTGKAAAKTSVRAATVIVAIRTRIVFWKWVILLPPYADSSETPFVS